jgi:AraC-like DNA-binding protein
MDMMDLLEQWAPFVYFGQTVNRPRAGMEGHLWVGCHALYAMLDGTLVLRRRGGGMLTLRAGSCLLAEPGDRVTRATRAHLIRIVYDVVARARVRGPDGITRPVDATAQPSWADLLGRALPAPLPPELGATALTTAHGLATLQVRRRSAVLRGCALLGAFLAEMLERTMPDLDGEVSVPPEGDFATTLEVLLMREAASGITIAGAAQRLGITARHCIRRYRDQRGGTPGRFLQRYRIRQAKVLLTDPARPLDEIATAVGFGHASGLRACFRRWEHCPPDAWRRRDRGGI